MKKIYSLILLVLVQAEVYGASGGLQKVSTFLDHIKTILTAISIVTVTIAFLWVGYKVLFGGQTLRELSPVIIGAVIIASAAEAAALLMS